MNRVPVPLLFKSFYVFLIVLFGTSLLGTGFVESKEFRKRAGEGEFFTPDDIVAEVKFGRLLAAKVLGKYKLYQKDARLVKYVNLVGQALARYSGRPELTFHFAILDTDSVNAFAAPGGYIFITRGSIATMTSEAQLAGVLAHEISHVSQKHIVRELKIRAADNSGISNFTALVQAVAGGSSVDAIFQELADRAAELLFEKGLKKEDEFEADKLGVIMAAQVGYRPAALREYLGLIGTEKESKSLLWYRKTHPSANDRVEKISTFEAASGLRDMSGKKEKERFKRYVAE